MFSGTSFHVIQKSSWDINIFPKIYEIALRLSLPGTQGIQEIFMEHFRASWCSAATCPKTEPRSREIAELGLETRSPLAKPGVHQAAAFIPLSGFFNFVLYQLSYIRGNRNSLAVWAEKEVNGRRGQFTEKLKLPESAQGQKSGGHRESGEEETRGIYQLCPQLVNVHFNTGRPWTL